MTEAKYQIGDCLSGTEIYIRGIATLSTGKHRYFLQISDNTMIIDGEAIDNVIELYKPSIGANK